MKANDNTPSPRSQPPAPVRITFFQGDATNCFPEDEVDCNWEQFASIYRGSATAARGAEKASRGYAIFAQLEPSTEKSIAGVERRRRAKTPGWSMNLAQKEAVLRFGYRDTAHTVHASALVCDYDEDPAAEPTWAPEDWPCEVFAHSTHRYHPTEAPGRWRAFLRLKEPIPIGKYEAVRRAVRKMLPKGALVRAAHQPAFLPTCPAESEVAYATVPGGPLDWKALDLKPEKPALPTVEAAKPDPDAEEACVALMGAVWPVSGDGACHKAALALGGVLGDSEWGLSRCLDLAGKIFEAGDNEGAHLFDAVQTSLLAKRTDPDALVYGWPVLRECMATREGSTDEAINAACKALDALLTPPPLQLETGDHTELARILMASPKQLKGAIFDEGALWHRDSRGVWIEIPDSQVTRWVMGFSGLEYNIKINEKTGVAKGTKLHIGARTCSSVYKLCCDELDKPGFFSAAPVGIPFQNGFLRVGKTSLESKTEPLADCRTRRVLPFDAPRPDTIAKQPPMAWIGFLQSVWGEDVEAIACIHEILGYLLSGGMEHQKMFVFVGPPRAGKGVVIRLLSALFGPAFGSFKVAALDKDFAMQSMLGKSVIVDPDVRRGRGVGRDDGAIAERLLSTSAADPQRIARKYGSDMLTTLQCRIVMAANPPFGLSDIGSALSKRMVIVQFPKSFLGREDLNLADKLLKELPQIVMLALDGLYALTARGRFVEPASSQVERDAARHIESPMTSFLEEECVLQEGVETPCLQLYEAAKQWAMRTGHRQMSNTRFSEVLRQQGITRKRPKLDGIRQPRVYVGIRLASTSPIAVVR